MHGDLGEAIHPGCQPEPGFERLDRKRLEKLAFPDEGLTDGVHAVPDAAVVVAAVAVVDELVEFAQRVDLGDRHEVVSPEAADVSFDTALLMGSGDSGLAVEGVDVEFSELGSAPA